jgi:hypothetical protein
LEDQSVDIAYTIDRGPIAEMSVQLNPAGRLRFFVSQTTPPGSYEFVRFRPSSSSKWIKSTAQLRVIQ